MKKLPMYKTLTRTSLGEVECTPLPYVGVYVLAYMGHVVYVGKTNDNVAHRLVNHYTNRMTEALGNWMEKVKADWLNVALDVLEPPDSVDGDYWIRSVEAALIRRLNPLFNDKMVMDASD